MPQGIVAQPSKRSRIEQTIDRIDRVCDNQGKLEGGWELDDLKSVSEIFEGGKGYSNVPCKFCPASRSRMEQKEQNEKGRAKTPSVVVVGEGRTGQP